MNTCRTNLVKLSSCLSSTRNARGSKLMSSPVFSGDSVSRDGQVKVRWLALTDFLIYLTVYLLLYGFFCCLILLLMTTRAYTCTYDSLEFKRAFHTLCIYIVAQSCWVVGPQNRLAKVLSARHLLKRSVELVSAGPSRKQLLM